MSPNLQIFFNEGAKRLHVALPEQICFREGDAAKKDSLCLGPYKAAQHVVATTTLFQLQHAASLSAAGMREEVTQGLDVVALPGWAIRAPVQVHESIRVHARGLNSVPKHAVVRASAPGFGAVDTARQVPHSGTPKRVHEPIGQFHGLDVHETQRRSVKPGIHTHSVTHVHHIVLIPSPYLAVLGKPFDGPVGDQKVIPRVGLHKVATPRKRLVHAAPTGF